MTWWAPASSVLDLGPSEARGKGVDCYIQTPKSQFWKFQSKTCSIKRISISTCPQRFVDLPRLWWFNPLWRERHAYFSFFENEWIFDCTLHFSKILLFTWHHLTGLLYTVGVQLPTFFSRDHLLQEFFKDCEEIGILIGVLEEFWLEKSDGCAIHSELFHNFLRIPLPSACLTNFRPEKLSLL